jgi:Carboxypeptidase regulatory-like domain
MNMFPPSRSRRYDITLLFVLLLSASASLRAQAPAAAQNAAPAATFRISGTIVSSLNGAPLNKASVSLVSTRNPQQALRIITAENGVFEFNGLLAGKFSLQGAKRGFLSAAYEQHEQFSTAIVTGGGVDTENLVLRLTPLAFLSGRVADEFGDPVRDARVSLYRSSTRAGISRVELAGNDTTDDQGYYEFPAVAPGDYFVSATGKPWYAVNPVLSPQANGANPTSSVARSLDVAYPTTYYSGATDADSATPIAIRAGDRVQVDLHLNPVPALHLLFHVDQRKLGNGVPTFYKRAFNNTEFVELGGVQGNTSGSDTIYEITGLPAGRYTVTIQAQGSQQSSEVVLSENGQDLDLSHGEPSATVKLRAVLPPGETPPRQLFLWLRNTRQNAVANSAVNSANEVTFNSVPPGKYDVLAGSNAKPYSITRMSSPAGEIAGHNIEVTPGASLDLTVFLTGGVVTLEGVVQRGEKPASGIMVALVPSNPESHLELFRRDQSDLDGTFVLQSVIPGSYTLVAVEDAWGFAWLQPGVLARYLRNGQNITVSASMKGSITLPAPVQVQPR